MGLATEAAAERKIMTAWLLAIALVAGAIAILLGWVIIRSIAGPLREATDLAQRVANGDLTGSFRCARRTRSGASCSRLPA
jgi:methyl-accepting chemotaxis protein